MARKIGIVMAMEEELLAQQPDQVIEDDGTEEAMNEVNDTDEEISDSMDDIEDVSDSTDELTDIADVMEKTTQNGGMDEQAAMIAEVAIENIYTRMGVKRHAKMPAMESFADKHSKLQATKIAVESIRKFAKGVLEQIISAMESLGKYIADIVKKIFDLNYKMKQRALAYGQKIKKVSFTKDDVKSKNISTAKALALKSDISNFPEQVKQGLSKLINISSENGKLIETVLSLTPENFEEKSESVFQKLKYKRAVGKTEGFKQPTEHETLTASEVLPGSLVFLCETSIVEKSTVTFKFSLSEANPGKPLEIKATEYPLANLSEATDILANVSLLADNIASNKTQCEGILTTRKAFIEKVKSIFTKAESKDQEDDSDKAGTAHIKSFSMAFNNATKTLSVDTNKFSVRVGLQALKYVEESMNAQGGGSPKTKEEDKK